MRFKIGCIYPKNSIYYQEEVMKMMVNTDTLVSMTEANQNFSKVAVILKNNKPFYIVVDFKEYEEIKAIQESRKRKIAEMTEQLIEDNKEAFLELAK